METVVCNRPQKLKGLHDICQIYCIDYSSIVVSSLGKISAFGSNENNILMTHNKEFQRKKSDTILIVPKEVILPDNFEKPNRTQAVQSFFGRVDFYTAERPVKSKASEIAVECEKLREENAKYRKKVLDFQLKFARLGEYQDSKKDSDIYAGLNMKDQQQLKKTIGEDKVISSIQKLLESSKVNRDALENDRKKLKEKFDEIDKQVRELEGELESINRLTREAEREYATEMADHQNRFLQAPQENRHELKAEERKLNRDYKAKIRTLTGQKTNTTANRGEKT